MKLDLIIEAIRQGKNLNTKIKLKFPLVYAAVMS